MGTAVMARRNKQNTRGAAIAQAIMEEYQPQTREEMQDAIKDIFGPMFEAMLQGLCQLNCVSKLSEYSH